MSISLDVPILFARLFEFVSAIHEVQQKAGFKNLLLEKKLLALADVLEKKEAQLNEVLIDFEKQGVDIYHGIAMIYFYFAR